MLMDHNVTGVQLVKILHMSCDAIWLQYTDNYHNLVSGMSKVTR